MAMTKLTIVSAVARSIVWDLVYYGDGAQFSTLSAHLP
jgi:hypothetical protein